MIFCGPGSFFSLETRIISTPQGCCKDPEIVKEKWLCRLQSVLGELLLFEQQQSEEACPFWVLPDYTRM